LAQFNSGERPLLAPPETRLPALPHRPTLWLDLSLLRVLGSKERKGEGGGEERKGKDGGKGDKEKRETAPCGCFCLASSL